MKEDKLDFEKTIVAEAVSDISAKRYASNQNKNSSSEWVTAANAKVREQSHSPSNKSQEKARGVDANRVPSPANTGNQKSRDVLSEFSRVDSYTREKNINFNSINEQDTELMTSSRRRVSPVDIQQWRRTSASARPVDPVRRAPVVDRAPQRNPQQVASTQGVQGVRKPPAPVRNTAEAPRASTKSSEWASVRSVRNSGAQARPSANEKRAPEKQREAKIALASTKNQDLRAGRTPNLAQKRKRVFVPVDAEEVILLPPLPKRHRISPLTGICILVSLVLAIATLLLCIGASTKITKVTVKTADIASINSSIIEICEKYEGKSYVTLNEGKLSDEIKEISALVEDVKIEGKYPRRLNVSVFYDSPRYYALDNEGIVYVMSSELKVLHIYGQDEEFESDTLTKLALPSFSVEKAGQTIKFNANATYVKEVTQALADYRGLGHISYVSFANTQRIYFIFNGNVRCDLGSSEEIELKLKSAENAYRESVLPALGEGSDRSAVINVSVPSSATYRLDAELGVTE